MFPVTHCDLIMDSTKPQPLEETAAHPGPKVVDAIDQDVVDACDLAALGHDQSLTRKFDIWSILALAFCVLGTWSTFAQVSLDDPFYRGLRPVAKIRSGSCFNTKRPKKRAANTNPSPLHTGPQQRLDQWWPYRHPMGPVSCDHLQRLCRHLPRRALQ